MRPTLIVCLLAFAFDVLAGETKDVREFRSHVEIVADTQVLYEVTQIIRLSDDIDENVILVHDAGHGDFIITRRWTYEDQMIRYRIGHVKSNAFAQISYKAPFTSKTRQDTLREGRENPALMETPAIMRLETNGGEWQVVDEELRQAPRLRQFRRDIRQTLDFALLEAIERMRGTAFVKEWSFYELLGHYFVYESSAVGEASKEIGVKRTAAPDCAFDSRFGYACSQKQLDRVKKASSDSKMLEKY